MNQGFSPATEYYICKVKNKWRLENCSILAKTVLENMSCGSYLPSGANRTALTVRVCRLRAERNVTQGWASRLNSHNWEIDRQTDSTHSMGFYFQTTFHKNPQLTTTYRQKAPIAQYVRRIDAQIAVRFCAICSIYIMPKALGDILTVSILIGGCVLYSPSLPCVCRHFVIFFAAVQCGYIYSWQNGGTHKIGE